MDETRIKGVRGAVNVTFGPYNGYVYFFHEDGTYSRFDRVGCRLEHTAPTAANWPGWPAGWTHPEATVTWDTRYAYFLRSAEYARYDLERDRGEGVKPVEPYWPNWPREWQGRADAGLYWGYHAGQKRRKAYFFRGDQYLRYDLAEDRVEDGYPLRVRDHWAGWPAGWSRVTASVDWGNGKVYFFNGKEYLRYDRFADRVDPGYPRPLADFFREHREKLEREGASLLFEDQLPAGLRASFVGTVRALAAELGIRPNWLMASMWMESGFDPKAGLKAGNFIGLHQLSLELIYRLWGKSALPLMHPDLFRGQPFEQLTPAAKRAMAEAFASLGYGQIHVVAAWLRGSLRSFRARCRSFDQLRLVGFGGVGLGQVDGTALARVVAQGNPRYDLTKDGALDVAEFRAAVYDIIHEKLRRNPQTDSEVRHALG